MTARWITRLEEFEALAPTWDAALAVVRPPDPFLLADFLLTWGAAFLPGGRTQNEPHRELCLLVVEEGGRIVGGLPLFRARFGARQGWSPRHALYPRLRAVGLGFANFTEGFCAGDGAAFSAIRAQALAELPGWRWLGLPSTRRPWLDGGAGLRQWSRINAADGRIRLDPGGYADSDAYIRTLSPRMQANLRRCRRRAAERGEVRLARVTDAAEIEDLIAFQLRHNGPDRYPPDEEMHAPRQAWAEFTGNVLRRLARQRRLDAMALRVGGELAAAGFGFRHGPGFHSLLISHDPRFRSLGPGFLYFERLIDWCLGNGDPYLDMFADGNQFEKRRWCNEFKPLYRVRVFNRTRGGQALYWACRMRAACRRHAEFRTHQKSPTAAV